MILAAAAMIAARVPRPSLTGLSSVVVAMYQPVGTGMIPGELSLSNPRRNSPLRPDLGPLEEPRGCPKRRQNKRRRRQAECDNAEDTHDDAERHRGRERDRLRAGRRV